MSYKPITLLWEGVAFFSWPTANLLKILSCLFLCIQFNTPLLANLGVPLAKTANQELPQHVVSGNVKNEEGMPIFGASVAEKGTNNSVQTDEKGHFNISISTDSPLVVTFVGYLENTVETKGKNTLEVVLQVSQQMIDDVIVVGYGTMRKKDLTGSISHIDADKLRNERPTTVQDILRNTAPGLVVAPSSSSAKEQPSLLIR